MVKYKQVQRISLVLLLGCAVQLKAFGWNDIKDRFSSITPQEKIIKSLVAVSAVSVYSLWHTSRPAYVLAKAFDGALAYLQQGLNSRLVSVIIREGNGIVFCPGDASEPLFGPHLSYGVRTFKNSPVGSIGYEVSILDLRNNRMISFCYDSPDKFDSERSDILNKLNQFYAGTLNGPQGPYEHPVLPSTIESLKSPFSREESQAIYKHLKELNRKYENT